MLIYKQKKLTSDMSLQIGKEATIYRFRYLVVGLFAQ
jgi:hypothetical protein